MDNKLLKIVFLPVVFYAVFFRVVSALVDVDFKYQSSCKSLCMKALVFRQILKKLKD